MAYRYDDEDFDEPDWDGEPIQFSDPGGNSALRAATASDPRIHSCPTCESSNRLTQRDVSLGYQCDSCADRDERGEGY